MRSMLVARRRPIIALRPCLRPGIWYMMLQPPPRQQNHAATCNEASGNEGFMRSAPSKIMDASRSVARSFAQGGLFRKYVAMFAAVVGIALIVNGIVNIWFILDESRSYLYRLQAE